MADRTGAETMGFDPYATWLGIPPERRPPTHYDLLGLPQFESDHAKIDQAAMRRIAKVRQYQIGTHGELSQEVLSKLARARLILIDPDRRVEYDDGLRAKGVRAAEPESPALRDASAAAPLPKPAPEAGSESEVFASMSLENEVGGKSGSRKPASRWRMLPVWQVRLIHAAVFVIANAAVGGGILYATGAWKRIWPPQPVQLPPGQTAKVDPQPSPTPKKGPDVAPSEKPGISGPIASEGRTAADTDENPGLLNRRAWVLATKVKIPPSEMVPRRWIWRAGRARRTATRRMGISTRCRPPMPKPVTSRKRSSGRLGRLHWMGQPSVSRNIAAGSNCIATGSRTTTAIFFRPSHVL